MGWKVTEGRGWPHRLTLLCSHRDAIVVKPLHSLHPSTHRLQCEATTKKKNHGLCQCWPSNTDLRPLESYFCLIRVRHSSGGPVARTMFQTRTYFWSQRTWLQSSDWLKRQHQSIGSFICSLTCESAEGNVQSRERLYQRRSLLFPTSEINLHVRCTWGVWWKSTVTLCTKLSLCGKKTAIYCCVDVITWNHLLKHSLYSDVDQW